MKKHATAVRDSLKEISNAFDRILKSEDLRRLRRRREVIENLKHGALIGIIREFRDLDIWGESDPRNGEKE